MTAVLTWNKQFKKSPTLSPRNLNHRTWDMEKHLGRLWVRIIINEPTEPCPGC